MITAMQNVVQYVPAWLYGFAALSAFLLALGLSKKREETSLWLAFLAQLCSIGSLLFLVAAILFDQNQAGGLNQSQRISISLLCASLFSASGVVLLLSNGKRKIGISMFFLYFVLSIGFFFIFFSTFWYVLRLIFS